MVSITIKKATTVKDSADIIYLCDEKQDGLSDFLSKDELRYVAKKFKNDKKRFFSINQLTRIVFVQIIEHDSKEYITKENFRNAGNSLVKRINENKSSSVQIVDGIKNSDYTLACAEGLALGNYQFLKYFTKAKDKQNSLKTIEIVSDKVKNKQAEELTLLVEGVCVARDLVNEPVSYLDAVQYSKDIQKLGKKSGFEVEVLNKKKIESLKMGGLIAVNLGSPTPPTFNIMEWKPKGSKNKKPIVLVGKGIVYDTGGLSLKPTANSMDLMKSDMGGSAAVVGAMCAIAKAKLPVYVVGLVPATDNRPGQNAYAPGDVITMMSGTTVEVLNTDAEGRLVLADALHYAKKYKPQLVIDLATLTGAAVRAIGTRAIVSMGNADKAHKQLEEVSYDVFERLAPQPFWDDYSECLKSPIADLNNLGGATAGQITAGKFLEHFTKDKKGKSEYPYIHLDIAGPAFIPSNDTYRTAGGTGTAVRLLFEFVKRQG
ncbi:MAG: leucyl aminopeptidase family protein [Flavobacteriales bacterium]|nr:leucyl aminopeptidase family protein [Flavobacteriales bacterium]